MIFFVSFCLLVVAGQILVLLIRAWEKRVTPAKDSDSSSFRPASDVEISLILERWGKRAPGLIDLPGPLHRNVFEALQAYQVIAPDEFLFLLIGSWQ